MIIMIQRFKYDYDSVNNVPLLILKKQKQINING